MLKKLFISLLILSALTSEGINALPANIYNLYVNMSRDLGTSGNLAEAIPQAQDKNGQSASFAKDGRGASFLLSSKCVHLLKLHAVADGCFESVLPPFDMTVARLDNSYMVPSVKERIFSKTDGSPPFCIL